MQKREDVKLLQMAELLRAIQMEIERETSSYISRPDYIILGDFNSTEVVSRNRHGLSPYIYVAIYTQKILNIYSNL